MNLIAEKTISFENAIALTQNLIDQMEQISDADQQKAVSSLVASENGARGFFVTYLTSDNPIVDGQSAAIINGLKTSPEIVSELLVKNVAMSTAMKLTHENNDNQQMANNSQRVTNRSLILIKELDLPQITSKIEQLQTTISQGKGIYQQFLTKWKYDKEQKKAIVNAFQKK